MSTEWSVPFQGKPFNNTVLQAYAPTSNAEEAEVEWLYEDLQDLLELTSKKYVLFIVGGLECKKENALVIANTLFQQHKRRLYTRTSPDGNVRK